MRLVLQIQILFVDAVYPTRQKSMGDYPHTTEAENHIVPKFLCAPCPRATLRQFVAPLHDFRPKTKLHLLANIQIMLVVAVLEVVQSNILNNFQYHDKFLLIPSFLYQNQRVHAIFVLRHTSYFHGNILIFLLNLCVYFQSPESQTA